MTGRSNAPGTRLCLLALFLSCLSTSNILVAGEPDPIPPELLYSDSFSDNAENLILLSKLKQVREERMDMAEREKTLNDEQLAIQSVLEARARAKMMAQQGDFTVEELPVPNAVVSPPQHPGKRTSISYITLCHFKICNMGRKRKLNK